MMSQKTQNPVNKNTQRIQVFARCKPVEENDTCAVEVIQEKKQILIKEGANRKYLFDEVFPPEASQMTVYTSVVEPLIKEVIAGYNCTVLAYGQTGSGKTYTMVGERTDHIGTWEDDPYAGIIPRALHQLFEELHKAEENMEFTVRVSFLEVYCEELFDLLNYNEFSKVRLLDDSERKMVILGLKETVVNSKDDVYAFLKEGTARRKTAVTCMNSRSSRSHTVFTVTVHLKQSVANGEELLKFGKLNLVDLAGSENIGRSGAVDKEAREAGNINLSLLTLGRVIISLVEEASYIPYRASKLTRLLQDSLGGQAKTSIIATISSAQSNIVETVSTLDYVTKAKNISIKPVVNQKMTNRALIKMYTEEIDLLKKDLFAARRNSGFYIDIENHNALLEEMNVKSDEIMALKDKIGELVEENLKKKNKIGELVKENLKKENKIRELFEEYIMKENKIRGLVEENLKKKNKIGELVDENLKEKTKIGELVEEILKRRKNKFEELIEENLKKENELDNLKVDYKGQTEKYKILFQEHLAIMQNMITEFKREQIKIFKRMENNLKNSFVDLNVEKFADCLDNFFSCIGNKFVFIGSAIKVSSSIVENEINAAKEMTKTHCKNLQSNIENMMTECTVAGGKVNSFVDTLSDKIVEFEKYVSMDLIIAKLIGNTSQKQTNLLPQQLKSLLPVDDILESLRSVNIKVKAIDNHLN